MDGDDEQRRAKRAVMVSLDVTPDGHIISLDDAVQSDPRGDWRKAEHVTHKEVAGDLLGLSDEELAAFGYHILARLSAFKATGEL
jgi:hypothetical protein